jgi:hypothetical protein
VAGEAPGRRVVWPVWLVCVDGCAVAEVGWLLPASTQAMVGGEAGLAAGGLTARHPTLGAWRRGGLEGLVSHPRLPRVVGVVAACGRWYDCGKDVGSVRVDVGWEACRWVGSPCDSDVGREAGGQPGCGCRGVRERDGLGNNTGCGCVAPAASLRLCVPCGSQSEHVA